MIWKETKNKKQRRNELRKYIEDCFKKVYPFSITENGLPVFSLPDGLKMNVFSMGGTHFDSLGMSYKNSPEFGDDDGDLYDIDSFNTPEELFKAMLEETKR